jgi:hypothetical protein
MADETGPGKSVADVLLDQVRAERELAHHLEDFKGKWVAVSDHAVVANAATLHDLMELIDVDAVDAVFEVAEVQSAACYF